MSAPRQTETDQPRQDIEPGEVFRLLSRAVAEEMNGDDRCSFVFGRAVVRAVLQEAMRYPGPYRNHHWNIRQIAERFGIFGLSAGGQDEPTEPEDEAEIERLSAHIDKLQVDLNSTRKMLNDALSQPTDILWRTIGRLRETLEWYADKETWRSPVIGVDKHCYGLSPALEDEGKRARAVLVPGVAARANKKPDGGLARALDPGGNH